MPGPAKLVPHKDGYKWRNCFLNGMVELKDKHKGGSCVVWCSGPSFAEYDDSLVPDSWPRFSINETIQLNFEGYKGRIPEYWVLSDLPIVGKYASHCPKETSIISTHRASETIREECPSNKVHCILAQPEPIQDYSDGFQVFSRRTVCIAAVEVARYMGISNVYVFGLDHFRLRSSYYYDKTDANLINDRRCPHEFLVPGPERYKGERLYQTPSLRQGARMMDSVVRAGLWKSINVFNVNSPASRVFCLEKMTIEEFSEVAKKEEAPKKKKRGRPRKKRPEEEEKKETVPPEEVSYLDRKEDGE
jgi:hypothetical protein